jgi:hypothetical protein
MYEYRLVSALCLLISAAFGQDLPPAFTAAGVMPQAAARQYPLTPGIIISIYGSRLGPSAGCAVERPGAPETYKTELCHTKVMVGETAAHLIYVSDRQINLQVPASAPRDGIVEFRVIYRGTSSPAVPVEFATTPTLSLAQPAYVHMPVWIEVRVPYPRQLAIRYPFDTWPGEFGGHQLDVRQNGVILPRIPNTTRQFGIGGGVYGKSLGLPSEPKHTGRVPLHLLYRFDEAGTYEVRYTNYRWEPGGSREVIDQTKWTNIEILPFSESQRQAWLEQQQQSAPTDPVELLSDFLPSILAYPDKHVLSMLEKYFYHSSDLVRWYVLYSLYYQDERTRADFVRELIHDHGPTEEIAFFLSWQRRVLQSQAEELVNVLIPYLQSSSPLVAGGTVHSLVFLKSHYDWTARPNIPSRIEKAVGEAVEQLLHFRDRQVLQPLALFLGEWKADRSRELLWRLVDDGTVRGQALICLTWIADPRDLSRLAKEGGAMLADHLDGAYGSAAVPYLRERLKSPDVRFQVEAAKQLANRDEPEAWRFIVDAIEQDRPYKQQILQWIRDRSREMRSATVEELLVFVKAKHSQSRSAKTPKESPR